MVIATNIRWELRIVLLITYMRRMRHSLLLLLLLLLLLFYPILGILLGKLLLLHYLAHGENHSRLLLVLWIRFLLLVAACANFRLLW